MASVVSRSRVHYAWVVAAVTFVVLVMAAGFRSVPGVLFIPLGKDFGWSHALIGGAVSVNLIVYGLGAPFAAAIVERFGVRKVTTFALCQVAVGAGLSVFMTQPWELYLLWGLVIGSATGALAVPLAAIIANTLVLDPPRPRERAAHGVERERPADLPAAARLDRDHLLAGSGSPARS